MSRNIMMTNNTKRTKKLMEDFHRETLIDLINKLIVLKTK